MNGLSYHIYRTVSACILRASSGFMLLKLSQSIIHYNDTIMSEMAYQITNLTSVDSTVYLGADLRKHHHVTRNII